MITNKYFLKQLLGWLVSKAFPSEICQSQVQIKRKKMQSSRALRQFVARQVVGKRSYHVDHHPTTLSDLPSPQGSWKTHHDAKQRTYNSHLLLGIGLLFGSVLFGKASGLLDFHSDIPERPADIKSYRK